MLACSMEIVDAIRSGDPASFVSHLPVHQVNTLHTHTHVRTHTYIHTYVHTHTYAHTQYISSQDGSCNGLQHYAALGHDQLGAEQVSHYMY